MIPIAHAEVRVEVVNLHDKDYVMGEDVDDGEDVEGEDGDVDQHAGALVRELGPLHSPQSPLVLMDIHLLYKIGL